MTPVRMTETLRNSRGFILIVVLWIVAVLALISAGFSRSVQSHVRDASSATRSAKAELLADAGVNIVSLDLMSGRDDRGYTRKFKLDGSPYVCSLGEGESLVVRVQDTSGLINLNLADSRLIAAALIGYGVPPDQANQHAERIVDFRDADNDRLLSGAEKDDYLAAGVPRAAKNAPFDTLLELHQVLGLPPEVITILAPMSTLRSGTAGLDAQTASPELITAVQTGLSQIPDAPDAPSFGALPAEFSTSSLKRYYVVRVIAQIAGGGRFSRQAEIDTQSGRGAIPIFKAWSRGSDASDAAAGSVAPDNPC